MTAVDRKKAAELLHVSTRTIDRYLDKGLLKGQKVNGRILIKVQEIEGLLNSKNFPLTENATSPSAQNSDKQTSGGRLSGEESSDEQSSASDRASSDDTSFDNDDDFPSTNEPTPNHEEYEANQISPSKSSIIYESHEDKAIYKKLYEELQEELKMKQERLEGANYRVGQLEGLLKESVPLLEYKKVLALEQSKREELESTLKKFERENEVIHQNLESRLTEVKQLDKNLKEERLNKKIYLIILVILFLLQPLWIIFPLR